MPTSDSCKREAPPPAGRPTRRLGHRDDGEERGPRPGPSTGGEPHAAVAGGPAPPAASGTVGKLAGNVVFLPDHRADLDPDLAAVSDGSQSLTNAQLLHRVRSASRHLKDLGVRPGDVVALKLANRVEFVILVFAVWRLGAAITPINPSLTDVEVDRQLADSGARLLVAEDGAPAHDGVAILAVGGLRLGLGWPDLLPPPEPSALALLTYTSGTAGPAKGMMLDHANLDAMAAMGRDALELGPADRCLLILPLFHVDAIVVSVLTPLLAGASVVIIDQFDPRTFFDGSSASGRLS